MKNKDYLKDLRTLAPEELNAKLVEAKRELFNLRFQNATNQLDNTGRIKEVRKDIARIQTVMSEASNS
ncbi:MAG: 50S ribosomal protein L29 [Lachnospiraceae bacterium]|nr:50S ribosomal protein L29 [Lachnospiraceae bacterium]